MNTETKALVIVALISAVAIAATTIVLSEQQQSAQASKAFGQCNKNANKDLKAAGLKGKEKADARKAACKALKPVGNDTAGD